MNQTGERFIPGGNFSDWTTAHHISRYQFALNYAKGKRVLDIGCGVGYGAAMLAEVAEEVIGIDISSATIEFASHKYDGPQFLQMDCRRLKFETESFDLVVAFEVIEHIYEQHELLAEVNRVLNQIGVFIVSTPEREKYNQLIMEEPNEFHEKELTEAQFRDLLAVNFSQFQLFWQVVNPLFLELKRQRKQIVTLQQQIAELESRIRKPWTLFFRKQNPKINSSGNELLLTPDQISMKIDPPPNAIYMVAVCQK